MWPTHLCCDDEECKSATSLWYEVISTSQFQGQRVQICDIPNRWSDQHKFAARTMNANLLHHQEVKWSMQVCCNYREYKSVAFLIGEVINASQLRGLRMQICYIPEKWSDQGKAIVRTENANLLYPQEVKWSTQVCCENREYKSVASPRSEVINVYLL